MSLKIIFITIFLINTVFSRIIDSSKSSYNNNEIDDNWKARVNFKFRNGKAQPVGEVTFYPHKKFSGAPHMYRVVGDHGNCIPTNGNDLYSSVRQKGCVDVYIDHRCRGTGKTICGNHEELKDEFKDRISSIRHRLRD